MTKEEQKTKEELIGEIIDSLEYWRTRGDDIINQEHITLMEFYLTNTN